MALIIRVGCSRKVSADYQSRGYTIDLQSEFDPRTLDNTDALADAADHLFQLANGLLDQQVRTASEDQGGSDHTPPPQDNHPVPARTRPADGRNGGNGHRPNGNGYQGGNGRGRGQGGPRPITEAQTRAITNMAKRLRVDPDDFAAQNFNRPVRELSLTEGSDCIDLLKGGIETTQKGAAR